MWTDQHIEFFKTFGYVTASIDMFADVVPELDAESRRALADAYPVDPGGSLLLPAMAGATPCSVALIDDERLAGFARRLLGPDVIVKPPKITRFGKPTNWHRDCYMQLGGVKAAVYFGDDQDRTIDFDVIPASHQGPIRQYVDRLYKRERRPVGEARNPNRILPPEIPTHTVRLAPGQMLLFDLGLWHANLMAEQRLQWGLTYLPAPRQSLDEAVQHLAEFFEYDREYPRERYPYFPAAWERGDADSRVMEVMHESGVMDLYLARYRSNGSVGPSPSSRLAHDGQTP